MCSLKTTKLTKPESSAHVAGAQVFGKTADIFPHKEKTDNVTYVDNVIIASL
jgi:hypothetical protein